MGLAGAEREVFEAQLLFDDGKNDQASDRAYKAMVTGAQALTRDLNPNLGDDPSEIVSEFKTRLVDTKIFNDPFVGARFAQGLLRAHEARAEGQAELSTKEGAQHQIEEARLFVDAAYACYQAMVAQRTAAAE
jgi:uncharacterized protein (UPF0332 family)